MAYSIQISGAFELSTSLRKAALGMKDMKEFYRDGLNIVQKYNDKNFNEEGYPQKWKPLSPKTVAAKRKAGAPSKILRWTGKLQNSNKKDVTPSYGEFVKLAPYAKYHQEGGKHLPKREVIQKSDALVDDLKEALEGAVTKALGSLV